ncbi:hypothetical protein [Bernardetia sp.]|uniref:hypothetical protein n=1 Tax=Bernardetia sp. TaxID=1937974 RepID=UPI0025BB9588|nr:hypothetical protein [Bernardetia sp.]
MMKSKSLVTILWVLVFVLGSYFLFSSFSNKENLALAESSNFLKNASFKVHQSLVDKYLKDLENLGVREESIFTGIDKGFNFADSLYQVDKISWKELEKNIPKSHFKISEKKWNSLTEKEKEMTMLDDIDAFIFKHRPVLNYVSGNEKVNQINKIWLYQSYIEIWKKRLYNISYWSIMYDKISIDVLGLRGNRIALIYKRNTNQYNYEKARKNIFSNKSDTTIFYPRFSAFSKDYRGKNKPYFKIEVKKGQRKDFAITPLNNEK